MSKKDYEALAAVLKAAWDEWQYSHDGARAVQDIATGIADKLQADNPRFDRQRFLNACHLQ
jgi:hypothetical protein